MDRLYIKDWAAWAPGLTSRSKWDDWSDGKLDILKTKDKPKLEHLPPVARRRLSQLSKMVIHVGHELNDRNGPCKTVMCSRYGEISKQHSITGNLIENGEVRPSAFSLSVFNTPVSLLSIHEGNKEASTVLLSGDKDLTTSLLSLLADVRLNPHKDYMIIYADELIPEDYSELCGDEAYPYAFAIVVGGRESDKGFSVDIDLEQSSDIDTPSEPLDLLRWLLKAGNEPFITCGSGYQISLRLTRNL